MIKTEFKAKMADIAEGEWDPSQQHADADKLLVECLESLGYDCLDYREMEKYHG